jgi:hypothetical protein
MRWFWLTVLGSFLWMSTHEVVDHAGVPPDPAGLAHACPDEHSVEPSLPGDPMDTDDDHRGHDSHGHFHGVIGAPVKPMIEALVLPGPPMPFDSIDIRASEHSLLRTEETFRLPAKDPPRYLSAQTLLL